MPKGAPAGVAGWKRVATSPTVKNSSSATKISEVTNTSRVLRLESFRCMKIKRHQRRLGAAMPSAIGSAHLPEWRVPVR